MKKLLVLLMVLGLVSSAQAALSLSLGGNPAPDEITITTSTTVTIGVHSSDQANWDGMMGIVDDGLGFGEDSTLGEWLPETMVQSGAGNVAPPPTLLTDYVWDLHAGSTAQPSDIVIGIQYSVAFHCKGLGDTSVVLTDYDGIPLSTMIIHQIPEPMTIGLLGLGGLFLRRRR